MEQNYIAVLANTPTKQREAEQLAAQLKLDYLVAPKKEQINKYNYLLVLTPDYLGLQPVTHQKTSPFFIDFLSGKMRYRCQHAGLRKEQIARAVGLSPKQSPVIIDATAGLGRDSFILATLGYHILMLEKSPIIYALLQDALKRAEKSCDTAEIVQRLGLICADSNEWLKTEKLHAPPDVILLDPMFPERKKSALVKKEMRLLQELLPKDPDVDRLFYTALACAKHRLVVKRPGYAPYLAEHAPSFSITGKSGRFDIYLLNVNS